MGDAVRRADACSLGFQANAFTRSVSGDYRNGENGQGKSNGKQGRATLGLAGTTKGREKMATETKHTPGPWMAQAWSDADGSHLAAIRDASGNLVLGVGQSPQPPDSLAVSEANARLIAAAPALLAALEAEQAFRREVVLPTLTGRLNTGRAHTLGRRTAAAIALAKGEEP